MLLTKRFHNNEFDTNQFTKLIQPQIYKCIRQHQTLITYIHYIQNWFKIKFTCLKIIVLTIQINVWMSLKIQSNSIVSWSSTRSFVYKINGLKFYNRVMSTFRTYYHERMECVLNIVVRGKKYSFVLSVSLNYPIRSGRRIVDDHCLHQLLQPSEIVFTDC